MITSLTFISGYPTRLPGIRKQRMHFGDRVNVLVGPNGSGKSTILRTLAALTGCGSGGPLVAVVLPEMEFLVSSKSPGARLDAEAIRARREHFAAELAELEALIDNPAEVEELEAFFDGDEEVGTLEELETVD